VDVVRYTHLWYMSHPVCHQIIIEKKKLQFLLFWAIKTSVDRHIHVSRISITENVWIFKNNASTRRISWVKKQLFFYHPLNMITWTSNTKDSLLKFRMNSLFYCFSSIRIDVDSITTQAWNVVVCSMCRFRTFDEHLFSS